MIAWLKSVYAKTIGLSIIFGVLFWVIDGYFEYTYFHKNLKFMLLEGPETLTESLFTRVPMHSLFVRISFILAACVGGILLALFLYRKNLIEKDLRQSEETFSGFFNQGNIGMAITSLEKGWVSVNKKLCKMLGYSKDELMGMTWAEMTYPDDLEPDLVLFKKMVSGEIDDYEMEKRFIRKDNDIIYIHLTVSCTRHNNGSIDKVLATLQDITERKIGEDKLRENEEEIRQLNLTLEQRIKDRTRELEAANKELESFAYSVSHDLRAPLRSMDGFSVALLEDYADNLDDQGKDYLHRVREASKSMALLIEGILELSRTTRGEMSRETVNLSALAKTITADLYKSQPERRVEFIIEPELVVNGDAQLLRTAIENLLDNAWKFTGHCDQGKIELGVLPLSETNDSSQRGPIYFVKDNGAGFDMNYADKLFGVFQRLHRTNEFPGTGIGLATVERIIHRHGGRIWAEARVDEGATFYFTLR